LKLQFVYVKPVKGLECYFFVFLGASKLLSSVERKFLMTHVNATGYSPPQEDYVIAAEPPSVGGLCGGPFAVEPPSVGGLCGGPFAVEPPSVGGLCGGPFAAEPPSVGGLCGGPFAVEPPSVGGLCGGPDR